jgi:hypothetical protein
MAPWAMTATTAMLCFLLVPGSIAAMGKRLCGAGQVGAADQVTSKDKLTAKRKASAPTAPAKSAPAKAASTKAEAAKAARKARQPDLLDLLTE